jgi:EmrB/QacA subfamily drug resistance transporter
MSSAPEGSSLSPSHQPSGSTHGPRAHPTWTIALTALGAFMVVLDALVVVVAIPAIHGSLGGGEASLQWVVNAYALTFAALIIPAAALGERFGRRRMFCLGLLLFSSASAACALSTSSLELLVSRTIQGAGAAVVMPLSLTLLSSAFPPARQGTAIGLYGGILGCAAGASPLVGGAIVTYSSWHWIFWVNVPIGVVATVLGARLLTESRGSQAKVDVPGAALVVLAGAALVWGMVEGPTLGWASGSVDLALVSGALLLVAFLIWESRASAPMIPLKLFRNRGFSGANLAGFTMYAGINTAVFVLAEYYQFALHQSALQTGFWFLPWTATPIIGIPLAGKLADKIGTRPLLFSGLLIQAASFLWIAFIAGPFSNPWIFAAPLFVAGVGLSILFPAIPTAILTSQPPSEVGRASGVMNTLQRFGFSFGIALSATVFATYGAFAPTAAFVAGLRPALVVAGAVSLSGLIGAALVGLPRAVPRTAHEVSGSTPSPSEGTRALEDSG